MSTTDPLLQSLAAFVADDPGDLASLSALVDALKDADPADGQAALAGLVRAAASRGHKAGQLVRPYRAAPSLPRQDQWAGSPWLAVEAAERAGYLRNPRRYPFHRADFGRDQPPRPYYVVTCHCRVPLPDYSAPAPDAFAYRSDATLVYLSAVDLEEAGRRYRYWLGQCEGCGTIYWDTQGV